MKLELSRSAQHLLLRGFFLMLALGSFYGVWDNREFLLRSPFYLIAFLDLSFGIFFLFAGIFYNKLRSMYASLFLYGVLSMWAYTMLMGVGGTIVYVQALGVSEAVRITGYATAAEYFFAQALYAVILPSIVFGIVLWVLRRVR